MLLKRNSRNKGQLCSLPSRTTQALVFKSYNPRTSLVIKNPPCNAGEVGFNPWLENHDSTCYGAAKPEHHSKDPRCPN